MDAGVLVLVPLILQLSIQVPPSKSILPLFPGFYILSRTLPLLEIWRSNNSTDYGIFLLLPGLHTHMVVSSTARCIEGPLFKLFIRSNSMDCSLNDVPSPGVYM